MAVSTLKEQPSEHADGQKLSPSAFMRELRPEYYSDSADRVSYHLDRSMLEFQLSSITSRNETHGFEIFCRKLCERTICPNLRPQSGPEGGGDSKADADTYPVAQEIARLRYVGHANGNENWAFAFSAKAKWAEKVRSDVAGLAATGRAYDRIFFVTSQTARAKDRARIEDELSKAYSIPVTILDRAWIVKEVIDEDRKDIAFNYLGVGQISNDAILGATDYSRTQQLSTIEKELDDPVAFDGMKGQRVTEALLAAKLSRNLERPRVETDGRFLRAVRLAEQDGAYSNGLASRLQKRGAGGVTASHPDPYSGHSVSQELPSMSRSTPFAAVLLAGVALFAFMAPGSAAERVVKAPAPTMSEAVVGHSETAIFAGGCFWGVEGVFSHVKGVISATSGYAGGKASTADYETVSGGATGHAEAVKVVFDPAQVNYADLLQIYFSVVADPTLLNRQGPDSGTQYRSALFTVSPSQERVAQAYIAQLTTARVYARPIVTRVESNRPFFPAEAYHQDFMARNPTYPYIVNNDRPKVEALKRMFPMNWKA